jgi:ubiquinone/menaquinone biosynthesis C-methylase UbiE
MTVNAADTSAVQYHSEQSGRFASYYEQLTDNPYNASFLYSRRRLDSMLFRLLAERGDGLRLLDLGCGTGHYMARLAGHGFEVAGVDASPEMLQHARANNPAADIREGGVEAIPFPDCTFDFLICIEVLRYLPESRPCISEMARVLKPGGVCLTTATPLFNANAYWLVNRVANRVRVGNLSSLKQYFTTSRRLRREFEDAGFARPDVHGVYTGPINWVEHLVPRYFPRFVKLWEPVDAALADVRLLREFSNLFLVHAVRGGQG